MDPLTVSAVVAVLDMDPGPAAAGAGTVTGNAVRARGVGFASRG
ncbi:MAG: hypothetical protein ACRDVE_04500 [Actinocrinis sp.]